MNETPGRASSGSSPSEPHGTEDGSPFEDSTRTRPADQPPPNWSAQQPPPTGGGNWGAVPPSPAGRGGWKQPLAAPKPGVVPLRPLMVREIFEGARATAWTYRGAAFGSALVVAVLMQLASVLAFVLWLRNRPGTGTRQEVAEPTARDVASAFAAALRDTGVEAPALIIGNVVATAVLTVVVSRAVLGRPVSMGQAWRQARPQLARMLGLTLLVLLIVSGALLAGLLPGIVLTASGPTVGGSLLTLLCGAAGLATAVWLWIRYCLAAPALMLEKQGVTAALRRSAKLVTGNWWRVFGTQLLVYVLVAMVGLVMQELAEAGAAVLGGEGTSRADSGGSSGTNWPNLIGFSVAAVLATTLTLPISSGVTALLYVDQRVRREGLDLELARSAGATEDGAAPDSGSASKS